MSNTEKTNFTVKPAQTDRDPLVRELFEEMNRQSVSAAVIEDRTEGVLKEDTILQWRDRSTPNVSNIRLAWEALGFELKPVKIATE